MSILASSVMGSQFPVDSLATSLFGLGLRESWSLHWQREKAIMRIVIIAFDAVDRLAVDRLYMEWWRARRRSDLQPSILGRAAGNRVTLTVDSEFVPELQKAGVAFEVQSAAA
ncbi:hypothetical protein [Bradyrhizobium betae]|uniref:Uncharacterized protein n=1 Tax=Bradyrhizobium betae TaxID=244734 RepID=A0A5P6P467_9BRAD|nr:hypothetical protein [Bradyrhizobium betae]MCS3731213.1 hypothetical protein [Bradyrhizobium betae]QFI73172.1 hypothetical protein F8237_12665 [Bradyrhizobium betae]